MRIGSTVVALALGLSAAASGQSNKWYDPYQKGKKAFEDGKYQDAVTQLEGAVRADPRAGSYKLVEGVFHVDYFPYYYLALAYLKLQQFDKAQQNIDKARGIGLPQTLAKNLADAESAVQVAVNATGGRGAPRPPAPRSAAFDGLARQAESSLSSKQYDAAIKQLDQLKALDAAEYTRAGLQTERDEAVKSFSAQLFDEGHALSQRSRFNDAKAKFQQADQLLSGQKPVADALAEIKRREDDYQRLKSAAQTDFANKNYPSARDRLKQAQSAHPELFADDNLPAQLAQVTRLADASLTRPLTPMPPKPETPSADPKLVEGQRFVGIAKQFIAQGKYPEAEAQYASALRVDPKNQEAIDGVEKARKFNTLRDQSAQLNEAHNFPAAQQRLVDARNLDPARFEREGLTSALDALAKSNRAQPSKLALQQGLLALLAGDAQKSIAIFEPALAGGVEKAAPFHAYLGVAYATQALSALKREDQTRWRQKAVEQFHLAASAQPDYRLSDRVVSPTIIEMYEQARRTTGALSSVAGSPSSVGDRPMAVITGSPPGHLAPSAEPRSSLTPQTHTSVPPNTLFRIAQAVIRRGDTSLRLAPGRMYLYGMVTGGAVPSTRFATGQYAQEVDAAGNLSVALAHGTSNENNYTTQTAYHHIGGVSVDGSWDTFASYHGGNPERGASDASVSFPVNADALVVVIALASGQQSVTVSGIPGLQVDASDSGEGMLIAHSYASPGSYKVVEQSKALSRGQNPAHMADLVGVFVFSGYKR